MRQWLSLRNIRIRNKMLLHYVLAMLIPVAVTNYIFYTNISNNILRAKMESVSLSLEHIHDALERTIGDAVESSNVFYSDSDLQKYLSNAYHSESEFTQVYNEQIQKLLLRLVLPYHQIQEAVIYTPNPTILNASMVRRLDADVQQKSWYRQFTAAVQTGKNLVVVFPARADGLQEDSGGTVSVIRYLDYFDARIAYSRTAILKIDVRLDSVLEMARNEKLKGAVDWYIGQNRIMTLADGDRMDDKSVEVTEGFDNISYMRDWSIRGVFSKGAELGDLQQSLKMLAGLIVINLVVPGIITLWIARAINARLVKLFKHMKKSKDRELETMEEEEGNDEISQLVGEYNRMTRRIERLIHDVYEVNMQKSEIELKRKQAELRMLQSQINPHFLFNTLETIRMRSYLKGEEETAQIIKYLSKCFRRALSWDNDTVPLEEEISFIKEYLKIQQYRYQDKINYRIEIDERLLEYSLPKFCILTLVENACVHGIDEMLEVGNICVMASMADSMMRIEVQDNGIGIPREKLKRLLASIAEREPYAGSIGIVNIVSRLQLRYGDRFTFDIASREGAGTAVIFQIPLADLNETDKK